jgi:xanthine dehydrogenase YagS FAD-binding subunit
MIPSFDYARAQSLDDAIDQLDAEPAAKPHSGGTDLIGCLRDEVFETPKLVSLSALDELRGFRETSEGSLRIGAMTTITEIADHPELRERYTALTDAASLVASPQLRNQGTIGGNLCQKPRCWYYRGGFDCLRKGGEICFAVDGENQYHCIFGGDRCYIVHPSDPAPALIALDGMVRIVGPAGSRTVPVSELHVPPATDPQRETVLERGEVVTEVILPRAPAGLRSSYRKVRARRSWDFALAGVALALTLNDGGRVEQARVVLSGVAPVPWRSTAAEEALRGQPLEEATAARAGAAAAEGAQPLALNGYKLPLLENLVRDQLLALV